MNLLCHHMRVTSWVEETPRSRPSDNGARYIPTSPQLGAILEGPSLRPYNDGLGWLRQGCCGARAAPDEPLQLACPVPEHGLIYTDTGQPITCQQRAWYSTGRCDSPIKVRGLISPKAIKPKPVPQECRRGRALAEQAAPGSPTPCIAAEGRALS